MARNFTAVGKPLAANLNNMHLIDDASGQVV